jgi:hypothetical protein
MKSFLIGLVLAIIACEVMAIDAYTIREIRDPVQLKGRLDADFATVAAGVGVSAVTNASLTSSRAVITATAAVTKQTSLIYDSTGVACSNAAATIAIPVVTNATVAVTVVNGDLVLTNIVLTLQTN